MHSDRKHGGASGGQDPDARGNAPAQEKANYQSDKYPKRREEDKKIRQIVESHPAPREQRGRWIPAKVWHHHQRVEELRTEPDCREPKKREGKTFS
jgi:hypothetical protein